MTEHIMFRPVHNGLDYLESVIEHLRDESDQRDLKYAVYTCKRRSRCC